MGRTADEFWNSRPSCVFWSIHRYRKFKEAQAGINQENEEVTEIQSMHDIAGWGCHGN